MRKRKPLSTRAQARKRKRKNAHAVALGRLGGKAGKGISTPARVAAARAAGQFGGRPRKRNAKKASIARRAARDRARQRQIADRASSSTADRASSSESGRRLIGWTVGDGSGTEGYTVETYFDAEGRYKGPDEHGIEPIFDDDADRASSSARPGQGPVSSSEAVGAK